MPSQSVFDPDAFMGTDQTVDLDTHYTPFDEGEYLAQLGEDIRAFQSTNEDGRVSVRLDIPWLLLDDKAREKSGMDNPQFRSAVFVELEDSGAIASGPNKNVGLGQLRDALKQTGQKWNPGMLRGAGPIKIYVTQRPDKEDPAIVRNRAVRYAPMS